MVEIPEPNALQVRNLHNSSTFNRTVAGNETVDVWTNLVTNPRGRNTSGTVTIHENLLPNPRGRNTSGTVTIRENLAHIAEHAGGSGATVTLQPDGSLLSEGLSEGSNYVRIRSSAGLPIVEGEEYTASIYARADDGLVSDADLMIQWYGQGGYMSSSPRGERVPVSKDGWTRIVSHGIVPEGATHYNLWVERKDAHPGDRWMVRDVMFERGSEVLPFFDGDTWDGDPDFTPEWTGTPGASTSRLVAPRPVGWSAGLGTPFYSQTHDAVGMVLEPLSVGGGVYEKGVLTAAYNLGTALGDHTSVFQLWTDTGNSLYNAANENELPSGGTYRHPGNPHLSLALVFSALSKVDDPVNILYLRAGAVLGEYTGPYFDAHMEPFDPDFTSEWAGDEDNSASRLVAPVPVGWNKTSTGILYYSETHDMLALMSAGGVTYSWLPGIVTEDQTAVLEALNTSDTPIIAQVSQAGTSTQNYVSIPPNSTQTLRSDLVFGEGNGNLIAPQLRYDSEGVLYFRAAAIPGKYVGPYFDGHTELDDIDLECVFVGDVDDSVSAVRGDRVPHLNVINGAAIRSKGFTKFSPYSLRLINTGISDEETSAQLTGYIIYTEAAYKVWRHQKETLTVTGDGFGKVILPHFTGNQESNQAPNSPGTTLLEIYRSSSNLGFPRLMGSQGVGESVYFALSTAMQRLSIYHTIDPGVEEEIYRQTPPFSGPIEGRKPQVVTVLGQKVYTEWDGTPDESNSVFTIYEPLDAWGNRPSWGAVGDRIFEIGVDRGMIYPLDGPGVVWNGLISVVENSRNKEITPRYVLGTRYNLEILPGDFDARITAFTYPDEFEEFVGGSFVNDTSGLLITQQYAKPFNFTYRTLIGNDTEGNQKGYKLHLVYNAMAVPSLKTVRTLGEEMEPVVFTWDISTIPKKVDGYRGTAHLVIDSTKYNPVIMESFERILYGEGETPGVMPEPDEVVDYFDLF